MIRPPVVEDALILAADWRWRFGPRWQAWLAWLVGRRERFITHMGHPATLAWFGGHAYLIDLDGE